MSASDCLAQLRAAIDINRLLDTATKLIEVPSPTRSGKAVADRLAEILAADSFAVQRPEAGWPEAPAVVARYQVGPGKTLQFNGHLDTVHLPFVAPRIENGILYGSGASDMKGGIAAAVEAMRALRDTALLKQGGILLTAHDLHESPWGDGSQVVRLIDEGFLGDGVMLPEYVCHCLPVVGRGLAVLEVVIRRQGSPVHEVLGGIEQPSVIYAGARLLTEIQALDERLKQTTHPLAGRGSMFVGQVASGEIFNQSPVEFRLAGTRRWLAGTQVPGLQDEFFRMLENVARAGNVKCEGNFLVVRDAYEIEAADPLVTAFQSAHESIAGKSLPIGAKPFVDDGNIFVNRGKIPAISHGPDAKGAHTLHEMVPVSELARVALQYALTAIEFCNTRER